MSARNLVVTGASGHLGRRILELAIEAGVADRLIAITRNPAKLAEFAAKGIEVRAGDFEDEAGLVKAFSGGERVLVISTDALDRPGRRFDQHSVAISAAKKAGAKHVLYTSLTKADTSTLSLAPDHLATEKVLANAGIGYTILRNNWYAENFIQGIAHALPAGQWYGSGENGAVNIITRDDCARAALAALLANDTGAKQIFEIGGDEALTYSDVAKLVSEVTGKPLVYVSIPGEALRGALTSAGLPGFVVELLVTADEGIARGDLALSSPDFKKLSGKTPTSTRAFLSAHRAQLG